MWANASMAGSGVWPECCTVRSGFEMLSQQCMPLHWKYTCDGVKIRRRTDSRPSWYVHPRVDHLLFIISIRLLGIAIKFLPANVTQLCGLRDVERPGKPSAAVWPAALMIVTRAADRSSPCSGSADACCPRLDRYSSGLSTDMESAIWLHRRAHLLLLPGHRLVGLAGKQWVHQSCVYPTRSLVLRTSSHSELGLFFASSTRSP